jgi:hypothetical protein
MLSSLNGNSGVGRLIFTSYPAIPWAYKQGSQPADCFGVFVFFSHAVCMRSGLPCGKSNDVPWRVLIDENVVRYIAGKTSHVAPHLPRKAKPLFFRPRFEPSVPNNCDHIEILFMLST